jgi:hypothetical protein
MSEITNIISSTNIDNVRVMLSDQSYSSDDRIRRSVPSKYRLVRSDFCTYVLQGGFHWTEGSRDGIEWVDLPTIDG